MFSFRKAAVARPFALGKIPSYAEFLRTSDPLGAALDSWLNAGWQAAHASRGDAWEGAFAEGDVYGMLWAPGQKADHVACGLVAPSADSIGRAYPMLAAAPLPAGLVASEWPYVPNAAVPMLEAFYEALVDASQDGSDWASLERRLTVLPSLGDAECKAVRIAYSEWCDEVSVEAALGRLFPEEGVDGVAAAVDSLAEALAPLHRRERPATSVLLRLPLARDEGFVTTLWLDLLRRIGRWKQTVPTLFWAGEGDSLLMSIAPARPVALAELWLPDPHDAGVLDVRVHGAVTGEPSRATRLLRERSGASLAELLAVLDE
jgi:type VI secretion system protein ImpM